MKIRKCKKKDFKGYLKLKREEEKDYSEIIREKIPHISDKECKKDFNEILSSKQSILLVAEQGDLLAGFLFGSLSKYKTGNLEIIFVSKNFRRKGIAIKLINSLLKILRSKKCKKIRLEANLKNKNAIRLYQKLGFKPFKFVMQKELD